MEQNTISQLKKSAIVGGIFLLVVIILELIIVFGCKGGLECISLSFVVLTPGLILGIKQGTYFELFFNVFFYFLLGSFIGYLYFRFKER